MLTRYLAHKTRPIAISPQNNNTGPRLGGNAPDDIVPRKVGPLTQYFATMALDEATKQEVSIFVDLDTEERSTNNIYQNVSRVYSEEEFVQIVVHPESKRSDLSYLASSLSGHSLIIEAEKPDVIVEPGGELLLPSKLGGRPYFFYYAPDYIKSLNSLFEQGFVLFLQMTWAGFKVSPVGPWPFDEYTFHLLAKETPDGIAWRYGWG